ncbi:MULTISPECIES: DNA polymerase III [Azospirillum]|uniref:DNA polymerase III n=1 Tax=Azospirillum brasilense TaxID=192 RepID=A0ABU4PI60_AZOBR|nr:MULTISPECIES: DNA polymerase III [Azospirillum]MDW7552665.1 DNA polymerase III [Azospirillum brasilense]MDW7592143.1 DNA polymerase III [Azospirillum brasilense]MDW7627274.1 DNA polymerase III [Azospirillum brasilense]MDX5955037.1 DNA polymerase III [Azospirillum brasilense]TVZ50218.1 DNA polymerase-3 subunit epsilon [Azospirillum brasilense]
MPTETIASVVANGVMAAPVAEAAAGAAGLHAEHPDRALLLSGEESGERVAIHCEATSFDVATADLRGVAALRIRGSRVLTSQRLILSFWPTEPAEPALSRLLAFIGNRPLVGYYLDFTVGLLDRLVQPMVGMALPNQRIEVSSLYYGRKAKAPGKYAVDLRLDSILRDLDLPPRAGEDAYASALASAMVYLRLEPPQP